MSTNSATRAQTNVIPVERVSSLATGGIFAGIFWILLGLLSLLTRITGSILDIMLIVGNILLLLPIIGLYLLYRDVFPRLGQVSLAVVLVATISNIIGTIAFLSNIASFVFLAFPVGVLGELAGFLGFAWMTARASRLPKWSGGLLILTFPGAAVIGRITGTVSEFGDYPGALAVGSILLVISYLMYSYSPSSTGR